MRVCRSPPPAKVGGSSVVVLMFFGVVNFSLLSRLGGSLALPFLVRAFFRAQSGSSLTRRASWRAVVPPCAPFAMKMFCSCPVRKHPAQAARRTSQAEAVSPRTDVRGSGSHQAPKPSPHQVLRRLKSAARQPPTVPRIRPRPPPGPNWCSARPWPGRSVPSGFPCGARSVLSTGGCGPGRPP